MIEPTEEAIILSHNDEIALEDGEIEEEEVAEPIVDEVKTVVCEESEIIEPDNHNDSDVEVCDRLTVKSKKHKHHKKSLHRKRQLSSDEISTTDSRKKQKSSDDFCENVTLSEENRPFISDHEVCVSEDKGPERCGWKHDSDNEDSNKKASPLIEDRGFVDDNKSFPTNDDTNSCNNSPIIKEKWGNDSDEDSNKPVENKEDGKFSSFGNSDWTNKNETKSNWGNENDGNSNFDNNQENKSDWNSKNDDNKGWGNRNDDNKGWGNRNENNKGWGNRNDDNNSWRNRNDNNDDWNNRNEDNKDDGNKSWGNRNEDNNSGGYRRGGRNNWGNRNDDRNNRGFRNRGRGNWRNRNDDGNNCGNRNRGNDDWGNKSRDNDNWGNKNNDSNDWNNKNKDNDDWGNKNKNNDDWSNKNKDNDDWGNKNKESNEDNLGSDIKDDFVSKSDDEVEEKQAWNHTSDDEGTPINNPVSVKCKDTPVFENKKDTFAPKNTFNDTDDKEIKNSTETVCIKPRDIDDFGKWGGSDSEEESTKPKIAAPMASQAHVKDAEDSSFDKPTNKGSPEAFGKWNAYDSDDEASTTKPSTFKPQNSFNNDNNDSNYNRNDTFNESGGDKWNSPIKNNAEQSRPSFSKWGNDNRDDERKGGQREQNNDDSSNRGNYNNFSKRSFDDRNNPNDNFKRNDNNRNDYNRNDNNRNDNSNRGRNNGGGGGGGAKKWPCKYFPLGSCHRGDNCSFIHESPSKVQSHEPKVQELCRFYEHQECYKRNTCTLMHEEFPCKLYHAGSKMCPSGDSCKYSHAPLNPETKSMLEKYLDEKIDERTDKSASGSIHDNSDYKTNINAPCNEDMMSDPYFQDPMPRMYPQAQQDPMKFPIRPWNSMMHYGDMPVPPQMEFMQRQRFMYDRFPQPMPGRMMQRGFRGMMPNANPVGPMHDPYTGNPYNVTPLMSVYPKVLSDMKDPYIDNLAQIVVGKESYGPSKDSCLMKRDMMDSCMGADDEMNDYPLDNDCSKRSMPSPLKINSPEIPPGAYVPRTSMNAVQPNVRLGTGLPYGNEAAMMYGGYPGHPNESAAMMDYINMAAIHYYHNKPEAINYDRPWKLYILDVPVKVPYPLMNIDTQELPHKYIDPRLKGHPSVLNNSNTGTNNSTINNSHNSGSSPGVMSVGRYHQQSSDDSMMIMLPRESSTLDYHNISTSSIGSQLSSPLAGSDCPSSATPLDMERQLSNTFQYRICDQESPVFPISEEAFSFLGNDEVAKRVLDRSYLQDPRFKRKKAVPATLGTAVHDLTMGGTDTE